MEIEEAKRALEILRERKANSDRLNEMIRGFTKPFAWLLGGVLLLVILAGIVEGQIGFWVLLIGAFLAGVPYLVLRMTYPKDATAADYLFRHRGYSRSNAAILDEQIAEHEQRLAALRRLDKDKKEQA